MIFSNLLSWHNHLTLLKYFSYVTLNFIILFIVYWPESSKRFLLWKHRAQKSGNLPVWSQHTLDLSSFSSRYYWSIGENSFSNFTDPPITVDKDLPVGNFGGKRNTASKQVIWGFCCCPPFPLFFSAKPQILHRPRWFWSSENKFLDQIQNCLWVLGCEILLLCRHRSGGGGSNLYLSPDFQVNVKLTKLKF